MVNDPNIDPADLARVRARTLVIAGTNDMIKRENDGSETHDALLSGT